MPRSSRKRSEGDIYHVYARGIGRHLLFEDDKDRTFFLDALKRGLSCSNGKLLAWALMGNHFHLLVNMPFDVLSPFMQNLEATYAVHFNKRHDHDGHVFKGRFGSQPITSDEQLMACVRYIHRNPVEGGLCKTCNYKWSSYRGYLKGAAVTDTAFALDVFDGIESFISFHRSWDDKKYTFIDIDNEPGPQAKIPTDERAIEVGAALLGAEWRETLVGLPKPERDVSLRKLKEAGLTVRQIERLTGIGRNIIARA